MTLFVSIRDKMLDFEPERAVTKSMAITEPIAPAEAVASQPWYKTHPHRVVIVTLLVAVAIFAVIPFSSESSVDFGQDPIEAGEPGLTPVGSVTVEEYQNRTPSN